MPPDSEQLHQDLARFNHARPTTVYAEPDWLTSLQTEYRMRLIERDFIERDSLAIRSSAREAPHEPRRFVEWFEALAQVGPGQDDALLPWLAEQATLDQLRWFLRQETACDAGFEDLLAWTQAKLRGNAGDTHGPMLARLGKALELAQSGGDIVWESLAVSNLMVALATNRRYAYHSIGALSVTELTAPGRAAQVNRGLKRLGIQGDVKPSIAWNRELLEALIAENPEIAGSIAEGALLRLTAGKRCFERYRHELLRAAPVFSLPVHEPAMQVA